MSELSTSAVTSFLSVLRSLPIWLLAGIALAGYAILFAPSFGGVDPTGFRGQWGIWIWAEAVAFSVLTAVRGIDDGIRAFLAHRRAGDRRALRLVPLHSQSFWHLAKQRDDTYTSQMAFQVEAANVTDRPVRIVKLRLARPRWRKLVQADVLLPEEGSPYHSHRHAVPPHGTATASLHIMMRGELGRQGKPLRISVIMTDQLGDEYRLKGILLPSHDKPRESRPWWDRLRSKIAAVASKRGEIDAAPTPLAQWQHDGRFDEADLVLREERRSYAANGRQRGGLGSLNVTLQSEPNFGWTEVGKVPALLWEQGKGTILKSRNGTRLVQLHASRDESGKRELEDYLLSHLHKQSPFVSVAYFIFLALHRMGRTIDALKMARAHLAGDRDFAYSNVLGALAALISHEHADINPALYAPMLEVLGADAEANFKLAEKINLARVQRLDSNVQAGSRA